MGRDRSRLITVAAVVPAAFFAVFFAYPVATVIWRGLGDTGPDAIAEVWATSRTRDAVRFTVVQAVLSTVLTIAVGLPGASVLARAAPRTRRTLRSLVTIPFVMPTVLVGGAIAELLARTGLDDGALRLRHTIWAILLAHVFFNYAVVVRTVGSYWAGLDHRLEDQARVLGASRWRTFREITLPRLRPALSAAAAIVFLFSFTSFGVILVLGGPRQATIETEIHRYAVTRVDFTSAAAVAVLQLAAVVAIVIVATMLERRRPFTTATTHRPPPSRWRWRAANAVVAVALLVTPIAVIVERSFAVGGGYGLDHYRALSTRVSQLPAPATIALRNTVVYALLATAIAVVVGTIAALVVVHGRRTLRHLFDLGLTIPLGTSAVTIGFGMLIALDEPPLDLRTRWWIVPVAHALVGVPFVVRTMVPVLRRIDPALREVAATLGADPARVRREIDVPIARRGLVVGAGFAFAVSVGEFGATAFLPRRADSLTAPRALYRLLSTPGDLLRGQAMALAVVMMILVAAAVLVIESVRTDDDGVI